MPFVNGEYVVKVGRPSLGTTKKVSLTLTDDLWDVLNKQPNKSSYLRKLIEKELLDKSNLKQAART